MLTIRFAEGKMKEEDRTSHDSFRVGEAGAHRDAVGAAANPGEERTLFESTRWLQMGKLQMKNGGYGRSQPPLLGLVNYFLEKNTSGSPFELSPQANRKFLPLLMG